MFHINWGYIENRWYYYDKYSTFQNYIYNCLATQHSASTTLLDMVDDG